MRVRWIATAVAITSMWIATLFIAIFAPELKDYSAGGDVTSLPLAGICAAGVAFIATIVVAAMGFGGSGARRDLELDLLEARLLDLELRMKQDEAPQAEAPLARH